MEMGGITFGAKFHECRVDVLIDRSAHFDQNFGEMDVCDKRQLAIPVTAWFELLM
jgi:hypothetical protein